MKSPRQLAAAAVRHLLSPFVPSREELPFLYWLHLLGGASGPDLTELEKFYAGTGIAIDIGANIGLFTYRFAKHFRRVHSFEINPDLAMPIARFNPGNITVHSCGLSSTSRTVRLYIPVIDGIALTGWGSLDRQNLPRAQSFVEKDVQVMPLDDFEIRNADFIKIDVEGHELEVVKGAARTIEDSRPVMLVEVKDEHLKAMNEWFFPRKFIHHRLDALFHLKGKSVNHLYVPLEKSSQLRINIPIDQ